MLIIEVIVATHLDKMSECAIACWWLSGGSFHGRLRSAAGHVPADFGLAEIPVAFIASFEAVGALITL